MTMQNDAPKMPVMCKDCIHYERYTPSGHEICALRAKKVNPVDGVVIYDYYQRIQCTCSNERSFFWPFSFLFRTCGKRGRYFEHKYGNTKTS